MNLHYTLMNHARSFFFTSIVSIVAFGYWGSGAAREAPAKESAAPATPAVSATSVVAATQAAAPTKAIAIEHFRYPGPLAGVVARVDLSKVNVKVALADPRDPDGDGPNVGQLDTTTQAAHRHNFDLAMNASFFAVTKSREVDGKKVGYFVGNGGQPVGWHVSDGKVVTTPADIKLRSALVITKDGNVSIREKLTEMPGDVQFAVSGNAVMLLQGEVKGSVLDLIRHPRSAVGVSEDGKTLLLVAVDGRQDKVVPKACGGEDCPPHSRGVSMGELGELMKKLGAYTALNLDGGGSTALVARDPATGAHMLMNRPSDRTVMGLPVLMERAVIDVIGVTIK
jgi:hypothetical protein